MTTILSLFIIITGLLVYVIKPNWLFFYWISLYPVFFPIFCLASLIFDRETFLACQNMVSDAGRNLFFFIILLEYIKNRKFPFIGRTFHVLALLSLYILIQGLILHPDVISIWPELSALLSLILPLILMLMRPDMLPNPTSLFKFMGVLLLIQVIGALLNINGIHTYLTFYIPYDYLLDNGELYSGEEGLAMGTFPSPVFLSNFCTTLFLFVSLEYFSDKIIFRKQYFVVAIVIVFLVIVSGIRVSIVLYFLILWLCCLLYIKKHSVMLISITLIGLISYILLLSIDIKNLDSGEENAGILRQISGLAKAVQASETTETGTTGLTVYLIDNYFGRSPIIGNGLSYKGQYAYGNFRTVALTNFKADARLAFILVEYGIIGAFLFLLYFFSILLFLNTKVAKYEKKKLFICFCYYFILTIVDPGFFDRLNFPLMFLYALCVLDRNLVTNIGGKRI